MLKSTYVGTLAYLICSIFFSRVGNTDFEVKKAKISKKKINGPEIIKLMFKS